MLAWASPERFVTLTQAPDEWQPLRQKVRKLALALRAEGYAVEWAWTVEAGAKTGMRHVHLLQHGDYIPQRTLARMWGRRVDVRKIGEASGAAGYAMKEASRVAGYAMKNGRTDLARHLALNGGRGCHLSRRYLRGYRVRDVEALISPALDVYSWVLVPAVEVGPALPRPSDVV